MVMKSKIRRRTFRRRFKKGTVKDRSQDKAIKNIKRSLRPEIKYLETRINSTAFVATGAMIGAAPLNAMAQGIDVQQRIGNKVKDVALRIRMSLNNIGNSHQTCRVIFFRWNDQTAPTVGGLLTAPGATTDVNSPFDQDGYRAGQFKILWDRTVVFGRDYSAGTVLASDRVNKNFVINLRLSGSQQYTGNAANNYLKGPIWALAIGDTNSVYQLTSQYLYTDS